MIGRQVGTSVLRLPRCARLPIRTTSQISHDLPIRILAPIQQRLYAQSTPSRPGRPKKAVGEPSRPVKRSVKRAAKSPKEDAATEKVKARKETAKKKKTTVRKKKTLTPEEKVKAAEKRAKKKASTVKKERQATIVELKKIALDPPRVRVRFNAHTAFMTERCKSLQTMGLDHAKQNAEFARLQKEIKGEWRNITPAEREHYNHIAHTELEKDRAEYKRWVESHSVEEIEAANKARRSLRRRLKDKPTQVKKYKAIKDERGVKRPISSFAHFSISRHASGDFKHIPVPESGKLMSQEWKALSEGERQKYDNLYKQDMERYREEYASVYGRLPPSPASKGAAKAAAAA